MTREEREQAQADGDLISRQAAIKSIGEKAKRIKNEDTLNGLAGAVAILFDLPPVKPQPCEDAISRDFQIGDEVRIIGSDPIYDDCDVGWVIRNASERVKTMYVMRNDGSAGEEIKAEWYKTGRHNNALSEVIKLLPYVKPQEPKTGHWRPIYQGDEIINYRCSECEFGSTFGKSTHGMNYCPNCGAKMN